MFKYKREALFPHGSVKGLESLSELVVEDLFKINNKILGLKDSLNSMLKDESKFYYETNKDINVKAIVYFRRNVKSNKVGEIPNFLSTEIADKSNELKSLLEEKRNIESLIIDEVFLKKTNYSQFLNNEHFQQTLIYTNPKAYTQIFDEQLFNKEKYKKTRYSYIQRNIFKTNSLSWMGLTSFQNPKQILDKESKYLNRYFLTALLFLVAKDNESRSHLRFKCGALGKVDKHQCFVHNKYYTSKFTNAFLIREDALFNSKIVSILGELEKLETIGINDIEELFEGTGIDLNFALNNYLITPDFEYYNDSSRLKSLLEYSKSFKVISSQIFNPDNSTNMIQLDNNSKEILKNFETYYFDKSLLKIVEEEPIWQNQVSRENDGRFVSIFDTRFNKYNELLNCVRLNDQYMEVINLVEKISTEIENNVLNVFLKAESELIYKNSFWSEYSSKSEPTERCLESPEPEGKSLMVMFNTTKDNRAIITNVFPGNGFLLGREFPKMSNFTFSNLDMCLRDNHARREEIYEIVVSPEISSLINTGQSNYPKLSWPKDFKEVKITLKDKQPIFTYKNKKIIPVYFGSIPIHFFSGAFGLFLKVASPWGMTKNIKEHVKKINSIQDILIEKSTIKSMLELDNDKAYLMILDFFKTQDLPLRFFLKEQSKESMNNKPIFITLLNVEGFKLFKKAISKNDVFISPLCPDPCESSPKENLCEYINIITEKEIMDHVAKLSYL